MKKIISGLRLLFPSFLAIIALSILLMSSDCCGCNKYKYTIRQGDSIYQTTDEVNPPINGCITFLDIRTDRKMTICGTYSVEENGNYKPTQEDNWH